MHVLLRAMTGPDQVAVNHKAITAAVERLTATGWDGDSYRFVESLLLDALASGYRKLEPPPPLRGPGASRAAIDAARELFEETRKQQTGAGA